MKISAVLVCLGLCSCVRMPEQSQIPLEVFEMAFRSGAISVLEKTNLAVDKAGVVIEETLARDPDGTPVYITVSGVRFPIYDRRVTVVKGVEFPSSVSVAPRLLQGVSVERPVPVPAEPWLPGPPAVSSIPETATAPATRVLDVPKTPKGIEYAQIVTRNTDGTYTVVTSAGRAITGSLTSIAAAPDNSIDVVLLSSDGSEAKVRAGGPRADAFRAE